MYANLWPDHFAEPADRYVCHIADAIGAATAFFGSAAGAAGAGEAAAAAIPALTGAELGGATLLPEIAVTAPELGAAGAAGAGAAGAGAFDFGTAAALGGGASALGGAGLGADAAATGALDFNSGVGAALGGGGAGSSGGSAPFSVGTGAGGAGTAPITTPPAAITPLGASGSPVSGGPVAAAPAAPVAAGPISPAATGYGLGGTDPLASNLLSSPDVGAAGTQTTEQGLGGGTTAGSTAAGTTAKSTSGGFLDKLLGSGATSTLKDIGSIASPIASVGGLGLALMNANKALPGENALKAIAPNTSVNAAAAGEIAQGQQLSGYLNSGTLPPGVQQGIDSATAAAQAKIKSEYASRGMSGSSAEAQDLQGINDRATAAGTQIAMQLLQQGASEVGAGVNQELSAGGLSAQIYSQIMNEALQQDQQLGSAIGSFATALAGGSPQITLKTG